MSLRSINSQTALNKLADKGREDFILRNRAGLMVRRYSSGKLVFTTRVTRDGKRQMIIIGNCLDITIAEASVKQQLLKSGELPLHPVEPTEPAKPVLLSDWVEKFVESKREKLRRPDAIEDIFRLYIVPMIGDKPLTEIDEVFLFNELSELRARSGKEACRKTHAYIGALFKWLKPKGLVNDNPAARVDVEQLDLESEPRDRRLTAGEVVKLYDALDQSGMERQTKTAIRLLLLTGVRTGELLKSRVSAFDPERQTLLLPKDITKNKKERTVYLSKQATALLSELAEASTKGLLIQNRFGDSLSPKALMKALSRLQPVDEEDTTALLDIPRLRIHDLRRSFASFLAENLAVYTDVIELMLGHSRPKLHITYHVTDRPNEQWVAAQQLADALESPLERLAPAMPPTCPQAMSA